MLIATYSDGEHTLTQNDGWRYPAWIAVGYIVSRALAKVGVRNPYTDESFGSTPPSPCGHPVPPGAGGGVSRWKPVKQPVVGSSGKQCAKCERWFDYANYYRGYKRGYVEVCTKCIERARTRSFHAREAARKGQRRPPRQS